MAVLDAFDGTGALGSGWTVIYGALSRVSGVAEPGAGAYQLHSALRTESFSADQYAQIDGGGLDGKDPWEWSSPVVRGSDGGSGLTGYVVECQKLGSDCYFVLYRYVDGSKSFLGDWDSNDAAYGDAHTIRAEAVDESGDVRVTVDIDATERISYLDTNAAKILSGVPGICAYQTNIAAKVDIDNFESTDATGTFDLNCAPGVYTITASTAFLVYAATPPPPTAFNNYLSVTVGDGMGTGDRIK